MAKPSGRFGGGIGIRLSLCLFLLFAASAASAASPLELQHDIFVERIERTSSGKLRVRLEEPERVAPGDRLIFVIRYRNADKVSKSNLVLTNPLPAKVAFTGEESEDTIVSVDDGRHWGRLDQLEVALPGGSTRAALPEDVTHVRWKLARAVPAGGEGKFIFRARVRQ